jgi:hypothetical protein
MRLARTTGVPQAACGAEAACSAEHAKPCCMVCGAVTCRPLRRARPLQVYRRTGDEESFWGPVLAGVAAGAAASLTRVPTEVVKQRLQTREFAGAITAVSGLDTSLSKASGGPHERERHGSGLLAPCALLRQCSEHPTPTRRDPLQNPEHRPHALRNATPSSRPTALHPAYPLLSPLFAQLRTILAKEGVRGLYAGYGAFLLRDLPFDAIEFVAYEQVRLRLVSLDWARPAPCGRPRPSQATSRRLAAGGRRRRLAGGAGNGCCKAPGLASCVVPACVLSGRLLTLTPGLCAAPPPLPPRRAQFKQAAKRTLKRDPNAVEVSLIGALAGGFTGETRHMPQRPPPRRKRRAHPLGRKGACGFGFLS